MVQERVLHLSASFGNLDLLGYQKYIAIVKIFQWYNQKSNKKIHFHLENMIYLIGNVYDFTHSMDIPSCRCTFSFEL